MCAHVCTFARQFASAFLKSIGSQVRASCIHGIVRLRVCSLKQCECTRGNLIDGERAGAEPCLWSMQAVRDGGC